MTAPATSAPQGIKLTDRVPTVLAPVARLMPELSYYTIVSAFALGVDVAVFGVLTSAGTAARWAGVAGYSVGLIVHYILSARFVFDTSGSTKSAVRRFVEFVVSGAIGLGITWLMIAVAVDLMHLPAIVGKVAAVGVAFIVVFMLRRGIVFATKREK
jgi:putative flippase GtrA